MDSVGTRLRSERTKQKRTLADIAEATRISSHYLQAIEEDDLRPLPGNFFYKSFVKQYCATLGLSYSSLENLVDPLLLPEVEDPLPVLSKAYQVPRAPRRQGLFHSRAFWPAVALIVSLGGGSGIYAWWQKSQRTIADDLPLPKADARKPPPVLVIKAPAAVSASEPMHTSEPTRAQAPVLVPPPSVEPATTPISGKVSVDLQAKERTWVRVTSAGKTVFSGIINKSQTKNFEGLEEAKLVTGNAAGIDVRWNGKPIGPIGERGQVRMVVFTADSFQIVAHKKL